VVCNEAEALGFPGNDKRFRVSGATSMGCTVQAFGLGLPQDSRFPAGATEFAVSGRGFRVAC